MITTSKLKPGEWTTSASADQTRRLGIALGKTLRKGDLVLLNGPIGAGKTTFVKGLAEGLGMKVDPSEVVSPTFVLIKEYPCRVPVYHIDLYRLDRVERVDRRLIDECLQGDGVTVIEWAERAEALQGERTFEIEFRHENENTRSIRLASDAHTR